MAVVVLRETFAYDPRSVSVPDAVRVVDSSTVLHAILAACRMNAIGSLEHLWLKYNAQAVFAMHALDVFMEVAATNHVGVLQWLINMMSSESVSLHLSAHFRNRMFAMACLCGCVDMCKALHMPCVVFRDTYLVSACDNGNLPLVQWLCATFPSDVQLTFDCFIRACSSGSITLASWLQHALQIDVSTDAYLAFRRACSRGNTLVAEWLLTLHPHSTCDMDSILQLACEDNHISIVWLLCGSFRASLSRTAVQNAFFIAYKRDHAAIVSFLWEAFNRTLDVHPIRSSVY